MGLIASRTFRAEFAGEMGRQTILLGDDLDNVSVGDESTLESLAARALSRVEVQFLPPLGNDHINAIAAETGELAGLEEAVFDIEWDDPERAELNLGVDPDTGEWRTWDKIHVMGVLNAMVVIFVR